MCVYLCRYIILPKKNWFGRKKKATILVLVTPAHGPHISQHILWFNSYVNKHDNLSDTEIKLNRLSFTLLYSEQISKIFA